ncbi:putative UDP-glucose lipid carrier transferase [Citrobacter koseri]|nr:putative UDP-glucose lipid carrier transferase [Citrobacter koseri]
MRSPAWVWWSAARSFATEPDGCVTVGTTRAGWRWQGIFLPVSRCWTASARSRGWVLKWSAFTTIRNRAASLLDWAGNLQQLVEDAKASRIHNVYIAMSMSDGAQVKKLVRALADTTCSVILIPDVFTFNILHSRIEEVSGVPVVPLYDTPLSGINRLLKRAEDIVLASLILLLISPVLCCIALAVKFSSPGPIIFRQTRYGMDGKPIKVWKFRSMKVMENDKVVTQATQNDPRVTPRGEFSAPYLA